MAKAPNAAVRCSAADKRRGEWCTVDRFIFVFFFNEGFFKGIFKKTRISDLVSFWGFVELFILIFFESV